MFHHFSIRIVLYLSLMALLLVGMYVFRWFPFLITDTSSQEEVLFEQGLRSTELARVNTEDAGTSQALRIGLAQHQIASMHSWLMMFVLGIPLFIAALVESRKLSVFQANPWISGMLVGTMAALLMGATVIYGQQIHTIKETIEPLAST